MNHLNDLKSIYATLNKESSEKMPESISHKMENLLSKWSQLEKSSNENLTSMSIYACSLYQPTTQSITDFKSPTSLNALKPTESNSTETVAIQAEKTIPSNSITTTTTRASILTEENQLINLNIDKTLTKEDELSPQVNEICKEKSEMLDEFFINDKITVTEIINNKETVQMGQSKLISLDNTNEIKKSPSLIQGVSFSAVLNTDYLPNEEIEMISNDLFDWLLWIDHTLDSQVKQLNNLKNLKLYYKLNSEKGCHSR